MSKKLKRRQTPPGSGITGQSPKAPVPSGGAPANPSGGAQFQATLWQAPLPPPEVLNGYTEDVRQSIVGIWKGEQGFRHGMETRKLTGGFIMWPLTLLAVVVCAYLGDTWVAVILASNIGFNGLGKLISVLRNPSDYSG